MHSCDEWTDLLLDDLYGLLDGAEAQGMRVHLAACPACQAARAAAEAQQKLLARAAQVYASVPPFTAPAESPPSPADTATAGPATLTLPQPRRPRRRWAWMSAAAALLLAALGVYGVVAYRDGLAARQAEAARALKEVEKLDKDAADAAGRYQLALAALPGELRTDYLNARLTGPATYEPSSANSYQIVTRGPDGKPAPAALTVRLIDPVRKDGTLYEEHTDTQGERTVTLPAGLPVRPESLPRLEVEARRGAAREKLETVVNVPAPTYATHLATNKPAYRAGETIYFRALALDRFSLKPPAQGPRLAFVLRGLNGQILGRLEDDVRHGIASGALALRPDVGEGAYTLEVTEASPAAGKAPRVLPEVRRLRVVRGQSPRLHFDRPQYASGERGLAVFRARLQANGAPASNQPVTVKADLNGKPVRLPDSPPGRAELQLRTDQEGVAAIPFEVPATVPTAGASIMRFKVQIHDGRANEEVVEHVPVVAQPARGPAPRVDFFPEGGDLVAELPARVYVQAHDAAGAPLAVEGVVVDAKGHEARVRTAGGPNDPAGQLGAGVFTFTPAAGEAYSLRLTSPKGGQSFALPAVKSEGVVLHVPQPVGREGEPIGVRVHGREATPGLYVVASCRGRLVDQQPLTAGPKGTAVELRPVAGTRGVVRVTVCALRAGVLVPLAERLVYRAPAEYLVLSLAGKSSGGRLRAAPGGSLDLQAEATTESGKAARAWLLAAVVDEPILRQAGPGAAPSPAAQFYLTRPVRHPADLEDADLLLADTATARQALDLFLGTYGWRHFVPAARADVAQLDPKQARAQVRAGLPALLVVESRPQAAKQRYALALAARRKELYERAERTWAEQRAQRDRRVEEAQLAAAALAHYEDRPREILRAAVVVTLLVLFAAGALFLVLGLVRLARRARAAAPAFALACGALALCVTTYLLTDGLRAPEEPAAPGGRLALLAHKDLAAPQAPPAPALPEGQGAQRRDLQQERAGQVYVLGDAKEKKTTEAPRPVYTTATSKDRSFGGKGDKGSVKLEESPRKPNELAKGQEGKSSPGEMHPHATAGKAMLTKGLRPSAKAPVPAPATVPVTPQAMPLRGGPAAGSGDLKGAPDGKKDAGEVMRQFTYQNAREKAKYLDTVLWLPALEAPNGTAALRFDLPGRATTYRLLLYGHDAAGRLGVFRGRLEAGR
jgi:hypothetical protein